MVTSVTTKQKTFFLILWEMWEGGRGAQIEEGTGKKKGEKFFTVAYPRVMKKKRPTTKQEVVGGGNGENLVREKTTNN